MPELEVDEKGNLVGTCEECGSVFDGTEHEEQPPAAESAELRSAAMTLRDAWIDSDQTRLTIRDSADLMDRAAATIDRLPAARRRPLRFPRSQTKPDAIDGHYIQRLREAMPFGDDALDLCIVRDVLLALEQITNDTKDLK